MKLIDITRELFSTPVYPGDPAPTLEFVRSLADGGDDNLSRFSACSHNGTHLDAPLHFMKGGGDVCSVRLEAVYGPCIVARASGVLTESQMAALLDQARDPERLLLSGGAQLSTEAALYAANSGIRLIGTECSSIAPESDPTGPHRALLSAGTVILENLDLKNAAPGEYILCALPLKIQGAEASMVRAVLLDDSEEI